MNTKAKSLRIFAISGLAILTSASMALASQSLNGTKRVYDNSAGTSGKYAGSAANTYPGNRAEPSGKSDSDLKSAVKEAVKRHKDVSVKVDKSVVTLSGEVSSETDRKDAIAAARDVAGVRTVQDQIQVTGAGSQTAGEHLDDAGITAAVKGKILMEKGLSSLDISVDTIDGVVTLTGEAKSRELVEKAGAVAAEVEGVKRVDNKLLVKP